MKFIVPTRHYAPTSTKAVPADTRPACENTDDPDLFFPNGNTGPALLQIAEAKRLCALCPQLIQCGNDALKRGEEYGVWGGLSEDERRALRRRTARDRFTDAA
ncbi:WhiB family transcriptional regulator [Streptomyces sp. NPDC012825]|uniref:WhiB family transcriptional regulator n=1 Tax=Streptomyces sp. NPDC012825 TaxID=3364851 RepID=UPI0036C37F81